MPVILGQLAQSLVNFLVVLAAARSLPPEVFARVSITWVIFAVLLNAQRVLVSEQVMISMVHASSRDSYKGILPTSGIIAGMVFLAPGVALLWQDLNGAVISFLAAGALILVNDSARFGKIAARDHRRLVCADIAVAVMGLLGFFGPIMNGYSENLVSTAGLVVIGLLGSTHALSGLWPVSLRALWIFERKLGSYAGWATVQTVLINGLSSSVVLLALPFVSAKEFAGLRALQALAGPFSTPASAMQPAVIRHVAALQKIGGRFSKFALSWLAVGVVALLLATLLLVMTAEIWTSWLLNDRYEDLVTLVPSVVLALGMVYLGLPFGARMKVARLGKGSTLAQSLSMLIGAIAVVLLAAGFGITGVAWGLFFQAALSVALAGVVAIRHREPSH